MSITPENAQEYVTAAQVELRVAQEKLRVAQRFLEHPSVTPVITFWQYGTKYEEEHFWGSFDAAQDAWNYAHSASEYGDCAVGGVTVGGADIDDLTT